MIFLTTPYTNADGQTFQVVHLWDRKPAPMFQMNREDCARKTDFIVYTPFNMRSPWNFKVPVLH